MNEMIYTYDGSFEGFLCCIFDSYANKEVLTAITCDEDFIPMLFPSRMILTDRNHSTRVLRKVLSISPYAGQLLQRGFLTCMVEKEMHLYRFVKKLLQDGPDFLNNFSDKILNPVVTAVQHLNSEAHLLKGFVRFSELGGVLGSEIEPKNRVLPVLRSHFCARYHNETFFIYDRTHKEALFYAAGKAIIRPLDDFHMAAPDAAEVHYRILWKRFYDTIAIKERYNPKCRQTHMPKRYWNTMTEFQDDSYFKAKTLPEADQSPVVPGGTPALATHEESGTSAPA